MSKKNDGVAGVAKVRKSTKGIPRVTDKVLAMNEADRAKWLDEACKALTAEQKKEVAERLATALKDGREPKKVNFSTLFKGRTLAELTDAQTALTAALADAAVAEEESLNRIIAKAEAQKAAIVAAKAAKAAAAVA